MSLEALHQPVAMGQMCGYMQAAPGGKDRRFKYRQTLGSMYSGAGIPSWNRLMLLSHKLYAWQRMVDEVGFRRVDLPRVLIGNTQVYMCAGALIEEMKSGMIPLAARKYFDLVAGAATVSGAVLSAGMPPNLLDSDGPGLNGSEGIASLFRGMAEDVLNCYQRAFRAHNRRSKQWKKEGKINGTGMEREGCVRMFSMGDMVEVMIGRKSFMMTAEHVDALISLMKKFRNLSILFRDLEKRSPGSIMDFTSFMCREGSEAQEYLGAGFRVLRAYVMAKAADREKSTSNLTRDCLAAFEGIKLDIGKRIIDLVETMTDSYSELTQMGNAYKFCLPPDISMMRCFEASYGTREPNDSDPSIVLEYEGLMRKNTFIGLLERNEPVHATSPVEKVNELLNEPKPDIGKLRALPLLTWSSVRFGVLKSAACYKKIDLRTHDKSSSVDPGLEWAQEFGDYSENWLAGGEGEVLFHHPVTKSNDVLRELRTGEKSTPHDGFEKFKNLVHAHKSIEREMARNGLMTAGDPESLPPEELSKAVRADPEAHYIVNTEPKYLELHKPDGRLFYMATPDMKAYISSVERLSKFLNKGQIGNSIVQSYHKRTQQLRSMAASTSLKSDIVDSYFTSFDMSEFSKKFPMELVRVHGRIMAELTGDRDLARLDIIFRAGIVVHRTRYFEGLYAGVKGGFEGFLNFVWTACHMTVMELSLMRAGKQGQVMAYSDDGLLQFLVGKHLALDKRRVAIVDVMNTYNSLGLKFHLFKTLFATNVFEYLGLVAVDGRFMESWGKAISNLGIIERRSTFTPYVTRVKTISAQAQAAVESGCPVDWVYPHMLAEISLMIEVKVGHIKPIELFLICIMPESAGGIGIPSPMAMQLTDETDSTSHFFHHLFILNDLNGRAVAGLTEHLLAGLPSFEEWSRRMIRGNRLVTTLPSLTSRSLELRLSEEAALIGGYPEIEDPFDEIRVLRLLRVIRKMSNMDPKVLRDLIESTPLMEAYNHRLGIATSRGAYHLLGRDRVRRMQALDSKNFVGSFRNLVNRIRTGSDEGGAEFIDEIISTMNRCCRMNGISPLPMRLETALYLSPTSEGALSMISYDRRAPELLCRASQARKLDDAVYHAPDMTSGLPDHTPSFDVQSKTDAVLPEKMLKMLSRILATCPELFEHLACIVAIMGSPLPPLPVGVKNQFVRIRALLKNKPSAVIRIPQTDFVLTTIDNLKELTIAQASGHLKDMTTYPMTLRVIMSMISTRLGFRSTPPLDQISRHWVKLKNGITTAMLFRPPMPGVKEDVNTDWFRMSQGSRDMVRSFTRSMTALSQELADRGTILSFGSAPAESRSYIAAVMYRKLAARTLYQMTGTEDNPVLDTGFTTEDERMNAHIQEKAFLECAYRWIVREGFTEMRDGIPQFQERCAVLSSSLPAFMNNPTLHDELTSGSLDMHAREAEMVTLIQNSAAKMSFIGDTMDSKQFGRVLRATLKTMYKALFDRSSEWNWDGRVTMSHQDGRIVVPRRGGYGGVSIDQFLDSITVAIDALRESPHRTTLYNVTTFRIFYSKLMILTRRVAGRGRACSREEARARCGRMRLTTMEVYSLRLSLESLTGRPLGPDHIRHLSTPLGSKCQSRLSIYYRMERTSRAIRSILGIRSDNDVVNEATAAQTFLNNCTTRFMSVGVSMVPSDRLRSPEAATYLSGAWQMTAVNLSTMRMVSHSSIIRDVAVVDHISSSCHLLLRKLIRGKATPVLMQVLGTGSTISSRLISRFGINGIEVLQYGELMEDSYTFEMYPGEDRAERGRYYCLNQICEDAKAALKVFAKLSRNGELQADIVRGSGTFLVIGAYLHLPLEEVDAVSTSSISGGSGTVESKVTETDALQVVAGGLAEIANRRVQEVSFRPAAYNEEIFDVNPRTALRTDIGLGLTGTVSYRITVLRNEPALVAASNLVHVLASEDDIIWGAALANVSLRLPRSPSASDAYALAVVQMEQWLHTIEMSYSNPGSGYYTRMGVAFEINTLASWLRLNRFTFSAGEEVPSELMTTPVVPEALSNGVGQTVIINQATVGPNSVADIRAALSSGEQPMSVLPAEGQSSIDRLPYGEDELDDNLSLISELSEGHAYDSSDEEDG